MSRKLITALTLFVNVGTIIFGAVPHAVAANDLSPIEVEGLLYMREVEKLAHDVYTVSYSLYRVRMFYGISNSEQHHMDAVKSLLDRYGLTDPASRRLGVFTNPEIQALYDQLIVRARQSLNEAYRVGVDIEITDINDLQYYLARTTHANIQQVYTNLISASQHHLAMFQSKLR